MPMERETKEVVFNTTMLDWNFMLVNVSARNSSKDNDVISVKQDFTISITTILKDVKVSTISSSFGNVFTYFSL